MPLRTHLGPVIDAGRLVQPALESAGVSQADIGHHRVLAVVDAGEAHRRAPVVVGRLGITAPLHGQAAQVERDLGGTLRVAVAHQFGFGRVAAVEGVGEAAQQRQWHQAGHRHLRGVQALVRLAPAGRGRVQLGQRRFKLAPGQADDAARPGRQRLQRH